MATTSAVVTSQFDCFGRWLLVAMLLRFSGFGPLRSTPVVTMLLAMVGVYVATRFCMKDSLHETCIPVRVEILLWPVVEREVRVGPGVLLSPAVPANTRVWCASLFDCPG